MKIGIIGGSGLDNPDILQDGYDVVVETPYGQPSSPLKYGQIQGVDVVLLARHSREHTIPPTHVNNRANIYALKQAGCTHILATTAVGSLREQIRRGDLVLIDQFIDFTRHRKITFHEQFTPGKNGHTPMAEPFSKELREILVRACQDLTYRFHPQGTVITIEGPRFSTKAESHMFRTWGADIINMSLAPEVILANELGIPYAAIAMSTDYDCWKEDEEPVTWDEILKVFAANVEKVTSVLLRAITLLKQKETFFSENTSSKEPTSEFNSEFDLKQYIRTIPHWPKPGIMFRDITTVLESPTAFAYCIEKLREYCRKKHCTKIVGIESRGFIFGAVLAKELQLPLVLIRKKGKLPAATIRQEYVLEYGTDIVEVHKDAINSKDNVIIIDDLIATAGTLKAAIQLVEKAGGNVAGCAVVIELPNLRGREKIGEYDLFSLTTFEGD